MIVYVPLERIQANPWQTRLGEPDAEYIRELAESIKKNGLLQMPIGRLVGVDGDEHNYSLDNWGAIASGNPDVRVQLAFGHNRLAAVKLLNEEGVTWAGMPVVLKALTDEEMSNNAWAENEKRREHTPLERAVAIERRLTDFRWTHEKVAEELGISRSAVTNALRLLKLPEDLREDLQHGRITERQATALLPLFDVEADLARKHGFDNNIALIVSMARSGTSSEELRQRVMNAVDYFKNKVQPSMMPAAPAPRPAPVLSQAVSSQRSAISEQPSVVKGEHAGSPQPGSPQDDDGDVENDPENVALRQAEQEDAEAEKVAEAQKVAAVEAPKALTWAESTITATVTWWPGEDGQRAVMIGVRVNQATPVMRMFGAGAALNDALLEMVEQLKQGFGQEA